MKYRLGTRGSALALAQSKMVAQQLSQLGGVEIELVTVKTEGDLLSGPLSQMGGTGVFAAALRQRLLEKDVDIAVHSLKDLPTAACPGLSVAAIPLREDPRDALCAQDGLSLDQLAYGARVGTGSPRRAAQLLAYRPDLTLLDIRGNVGTRLARVVGNQAYAEAGGGAVQADCAAVVLAVSGLKRAGLSAAISQYLDPSICLPAPGQGALAIEIRQQDLEEESPLAQLVCSLEDKASRLAVTAERALLERLEAGCAAPVGAYAYLKEGSLELKALAASTDASRRFSAKAVSDDLSGQGARALGYRLAQELLDQGAGQLTGLGQ